MIDLSFLTEEEQEAIMKVLQRDAELKKTEEERVRHLPEKVKDGVQLKNMSGQWFYEAKSKRHRDKIHGADLIRASMRRKPATLAEVSQNRSSKVKNSWVSNVNKEVFVPPELHGIVEHQEEQPQLKSSSSSKPISSMLDKPEERFMKAAVSPRKQRRNPFNSTASGDNLASGESENRPAILPQLSNKEMLSLSEESQPKPNLENDEMEKTEKPKKPSVEPTNESQKGQVKHPVPKARKLIHKPTDAVSQREDYVPKPAKRTERVNGTGTPPRGILKHSSSSSSTDSEVRVSHVSDIQKKNVLPTVTIFEGQAEKKSLREEVEDSTHKVEHSTQISLEKLKQVRFLSNTGKGEPLQSLQLHNGRERGEFDLLESDEIKSNGNDAIRSDSFRSKQISVVKPSSALQVKTIDGLQNDTLPPGPCDTNKSVFLVNETLRSKTVTPKKLETPQKTSSNIVPGSNDELTVDEMCENKTNQYLSHESKSHKKLTDELQLSVKTEAHEVSKSSSTSLQQGKPNLVEERDAKTTFKPDKHANKLVKVADESLSKVLDWLKRSSGTEDRKHVSARSQDREPREEVGFSTRTAALPTEHSGPSVDGKTQVAEELPFRKIKQQNAISPTSFISENIHLIKERMKPKKEEENEEQNDKSLTEFDCTRVKDHGQEIKQQNKKSNLLEHEERKLPAQKCESEKAMQEKRRIREIREFWERNKTIPSHEEKEVNINTDAAGGSALKGLRESDKIKPTAEYLSNRLDDQSKNMFRRDELSCASQASINEHQNTFEFGPGHVTEQPERRLASDEDNEYRELPKASNLQPSVGATSSSPESKDKDEKEALKGKVAACSQQKLSFQILSLKEKMNEKSKTQISSPSQFQSLRNFWDARVKLQSSIDRGDASLPSNTSLITYERKLEEVEGRDNVSKQELIQQQTQTWEREKTQKVDSVVYELPVGSSTLNGTTHMKNTDSVQLDRKLVISKPQEKMGLPEQAIKECIEKSTISPKETPVSLQLLQSSGDKDALKETAVDDLLCLPIGKVENKTTPLDISLPKEEVAETVDKVILPKAEPDVFKLGLKKLEKEASEISSNLKLGENILKGTTFHSNQCKVSERTVEHSHDVSHAYQKEEISKNIGKVNALSTDEHENVKSLRKLFREFEPFHLQHHTADKNDILGGSQRRQSDLQNKLRETFAFQPSEYRKMGIKTLDDINSISQINRSVESTFQEDADQPEEVCETTEKSVASSKFSRFTSVLEKLLKEACETPLKEACETPPPKPKRVDGTVQRTPEMEVKSTTYKHDGELPVEIRETVEKSFGPSKVSGLTSALEKLLKEASETPPANPKCADGTAQKTVDLQVKSMTYNHDGELPQEIGEPIEKSFAPSKVSSLTSALEKLLKEASETPPAKPKCADSTAQKTVELEVESMTCESDGDLPEKIGEPIEKSVASSKVSGLTSALERLLKEASESPPTEPKCADDTVQRTVDMHFKSKNYDHNGELPQEIGETVERSFAPSRVCGLASALAKLLKEASEMPPPKTKHSYNTDQRIAEMDIESMTYEPDGELPEAIRETIEKSFAPCKVSNLNSALEKLLKEASETPPAKPKRADDTVQRTLDMQVKSTNCNHNGELPQEIGETVEKSFAPSKVSSLASALEKLLEEFSELPPAKPKRTDGTVQSTVEMDVESMTCERAGELPEAISETIEKSVAPSKVSSLASALEKLLKEASELPPAEPKRADGTVRRTADMQVKSTTYDYNGELPQEVRETIDKSFAPSKVSDLASALAKLMEEASEMPTPKPKHTDSIVQRTVEIEVESTTYDHDGELPREIGETIERAALSKYECGVLDVNLQRLPDEVSETPASVLKNMDKKTQCKIQAGQSVHSPHQQERDHSQEIEETIEETSISNTAKFNAFSRSLEKLLQEASEVSSPVPKELHKQEKFGDHIFPTQKASLFLTMSQPYNALRSCHTQLKIVIKGEPPEQNIKTSINDLAVSEIEASNLPERNQAINRIEERNMVPVDLSPLKGETNTFAIKPFEIKEEGRGDESTSLDDSVNNSEFKALLEFRRASTPLKDESNSFQSAGAQFCLASPPEDSDEEEGNGSNLGFKFSDENSDSHSGTRSSIRSEEELNPVLMALKRSADRKMPSKSLEDIPSATSNKGKINNPKEELALSAEDGLKPDQRQGRNENAAGISTVPSQPDKLFSHPEKLKGLSKSVPSFLQEESDGRETDTTSESSYSLRRIKKSPSSLTNLSGSSGMASLSSVSSSLMSIYSADFGNVDVKGNIQFAIDYVEQLNELHVLICQCKDLAVADVKRQRSDPYVKTYLLPEKYKLGKRKTSVKKKTFNPVYNEILRVFIELLLDVKYCMHEYKIEKSLLKNQSLNISVWHNDTFGRNSFLGEVELDLGTWDWNDKSNKQINWYPLKPRTSTMAFEPENRGEMKLALQYVPHPVGGKKTVYTGEVHIWVKECHDLPPLRGNRLNSFIKCTVLPDTSRKSRQKTRTVAKTTNPVFNHTMVYDGFRPEDLKEACIELTVWDHYKLANHFLGGLRIGLGTGKSYGTTVDWMDSTSDESALWEKMMSSPNTWIEDTLPLRMLMVAKLTK